MTSQTDGSQLWFNMQLIYQWDFSVKKDTYLKYLHYYRLCIFGNEKESRFQDFFKIQDFCEKIISELKSEKLFFKAKYFLLHNMTVN